MQESTKNPSFIPATHFYNDFKRIYNAKGNTKKTSQSYSTLYLKHTIRIFILHIFCIFLSSYNNLS